MRTRRFQAAATSNNGSVEPVIPTGWDPNKNIYIENKHFTRYDHTVLPYWNTFTEYCEDIPANYTASQWRSKCINIGVWGTNKVGITRLKNTPLTDLQTSDDWGFNCDFSNYMQRWTDGNTDFNVYCFYYLYDYRTNWTDENKDKATQLRLYLLRRAIEECNLYNVGQQDQNITNRNMLMFYGTKIQGTGGSTISLFKCGDVENLCDVQEVVHFPLNNYYTYKCNRYNENDAPFYKTTRPSKKIFIEGNATEQQNATAPRAAILNEIDDVEIASLSSTEKIRCTMLWVATTKTTTERSLLI